MLINFAGIVIDTRGGRFDNDGYMTRFLRGSNVEAEMVDDGGVVFAQIQALAALYVAPQ